MCTSPSYTSPIAVAQPSTLTCCPVAPMPNTSIASLGRYIRMDSTSLDFVQAAPVVVRGQHLSYYATIGMIIFAAWIFQSLQASKASKVKVPFYKASILKWYFSAETLVRESYVKVRLYLVWAGCVVVVVHTYVNYSSTTRSIKSRLRRVYRC